MLKTEGYRARLGGVLRQIENRFDVAEIRGSDVAGFIFAKKEDRAIEIYQSENAVILEFWENEKQQKEEEVNSYEKATGLIVDWMKSNYEK